MSETRFTPEQLEHLARCCEGPCGCMPPDPDNCGLCENNRIAAMLKQAAQDARVIEQLRAWLEHGLLINGFDPTWDDAINDVLAELDRLAPPTKREP